jgi:hypothetical protein
MGSVTAAPAGVASRSGAPAGSPSSRWATMPVALLGEQDRTREPELVLIRQGRMSTSPFASLWGAAALGAPRTALLTAACQRSDARRALR